VAKIGLDHTRKIQNQHVNVLIVDDDPQMIRLILEILAKRGVHADLADNKKAAIDFLDKNIYNLLFLSDLIRPRVDQQARSQASFLLLEAVRANSPELPVVMISASEGRKPQEQVDIIEVAVKAIQQGCSDFLKRPPNRERLENLLDRFLPGHTARSYASAVVDNQSLYTIVGHSSKLAQTVNLAQRVATTSAPVLISGESGTGKELVSYLIHNESRRSQNPYVRVNCAALSDSLLESELFGHEKGAFTGAYARRRGRFEMAHGGTLLLDEITETPLKFQSHLLRVLEQQNFERVGGNENVRVDVRIISTTNKDISREVREGRLRQDLYYRLSGLRLVIPPLRERVEDLPDLVWHFINLYAPQTRRVISKLDPTMMDIFANYTWPGNVRQLRNVVITSLVLGVGETLSLADVSWLFDELQPCPLDKIADPLLREQDSGNTEPQVPGIGGIPLVDIERQAILDTLRQTAGNQTKAAKILGISDRTLRDKVRRYKDEGCLQPA
jgi:DNA-binding NtrC family response regulator